MKNRLLTALLALLLSCCIAIGPTAALAGVYALPLSWGAPVLCWAVSFLLGLLLLPRKRGGTATLGLVSFCTGFFLCWPESRAQLLTLLELISKQLNSIYHLGYLEFPNHAIGTVELPVALGGSCLILAVCRSVLRRKSSALPLFLSLPPLLLCALLPQYPPKSWTVFVWLAGTLVLLLSSGSRKNSARQGLILAAMALIPVSLLCGILYLTIPQEGYQDHAQAFRQRCIRLFEGHRATAPTAIPAPELQRAVDLAALHGANQPSLPVLIVTAPFSGDLYLRGQSYDRYTCSGWEMSSDAPDSFDGWGEPQGDIQIRTFALQSVLYLPYYPGTGTVLSGGALKNTGSILSYNFPKYPYGSAAADQTLDACLTLPDSTRAWAAGYTFSGDSTQQIAQAIGDFVRQSAAYDKATGAMPEGQDFARWFLESSETGYCVHFATAATVLLRAAGIPARYVTGFRCEATSGQPLVVTTEEAHAWAEYYDADQGDWQILEATAPGIARPAPVATLPAETAAQTEPTQNPPPAAGASTAPVPGEPGDGGFPWAWLRVLVPLLLPLRRWTALFLRQQRTRRASLNRRCLLLFANAEGLSRALGTAPPESLHALAERARYSQHRLTPMELKPLEDYCRTCREQLAQKPPLTRFWNKYILLLY